MITALMFHLLSFQTLVPALAASHAILVYGLLFLLIFAETGLVIFPFLPGDSLLFLVGTLATLQFHGLNLIITLVLLSFAAILGDYVNFKIGKHAKGFLLKNRFISSKILTPKRVSESERFFKRHGSFAIILARFTPVIRTIVPFVAGMSNMSELTFLKTNIIGGIAWVSIALLAGYFFGSIPVVQAHFSLVTLAIVAISLLPMLFTFISEKVGVRRAN